MFQFPISMHILFIATIQVRFVCRSVEFNYLTLQCHLSEYDRRSPGAFPVDLVESQGVDYFENACLQCECLSFTPFSAGQHISHILISNIKLKIK